MVSSGGVGGAGGVDDAEPAAGTGVAVGENDDDNPSGGADSAEEVPSNADGSVDSLPGSRDCDGIEDGDGV